MYVSRWWRVFLTTFGQNLVRKCGQSLTLNASCIRNLFHQDRWWMENSIATVWGDCGETFGVSVQTSGATTPGPWIMTTFRLTRRFLSRSFWGLRRWQSSPTVPIHLTSSPLISPPLFSKMNLKLNGRRSEEIQTESQDVTKALTRNDFWQCFRWDRCFNAEGDYFELNGGEHKFRSFVKLLQRNFGNFWVAPLKFTGLLRRSVYSMYRQI